MNSGLFLSSPTQAEVEAVNRKLDDLKMESQTKLEKLAHLLDMRAAKIKKLEGLPVCFFFQ